MILPCTVLHRIALAVVSKWLLRSNKGHEVQTLRFAPHDSLHLPQLGPRGNEFQGPVAQQAQEGVRKLADPSDAPRPSDDRRHPLCSQPLVASQSVGDRHTGGSVDIQEAPCQDHRVLYSLAGALTEVGRHRVGGVAQEDDPALSPAS